MENREPDRYFEAARMQVWGLHARRFAANEMENNEGISLLAACFGQVQHCTGLKNLCLRSCSCDVQPLTELRTEISRPKAHVWNKQKSWMT